MTTINWNKPLEVKRQCGSWEPVHYLGELKYGERARLKYTRVVNTTNGVSYFNESGEWEYGYGTSNAGCILRNVGEKKRYTTITYRNKDGSISASVQSGVGIKNCEVGKEFYGKPIVHVAEFELVD